MNQMSLGFERHTSFENVEKLSPRHQDILGKLIAEHKGKENAIKSHYLAIKLGMQVTGTNQKIRKVCKELLAAGYPVISRPKGFFIAQSYQELEEYSKNIEARLGGLQRTWRDLREVVTDFSRKDGFNQNRQ